MEEINKELQDWSVGMTVQEAADAVVKMAPRDALYALFALPESREKEVSDRIFDENFRFFSRMEAEKIIIRAEHLKD